MIEIIDNKDNIKEEELTEKNGRIKVIAINDRNEVVLIKNHNTYYFLGEYIADTVENALIDCLKKEINFELDEIISPSLLQKEYISDYPLFGDKTLNYTYYFIVNIRSLEIDISNNSNKHSIELISLDSLVDVLEDNMFDNPRNRLLTENMINVVKKLF